MRVRRWWNSGEGRALNSNLSVNFGPGLWFWEDTLSVLWVASPIPPTPGPFRPEILWLWITELLLEFQSVGREFMRNTFCWAYTSGAVSGRRMGGTGNLRGRGIPACLQQYRDLHACYREYSSGYLLIGITQHTSCCCWGPCNLSSRTILASRDSVWVSLTFYRP